MSTKDCAKAAEFCASERHGPSLEQNCPNACKWKETLRLAMSVVESEEVDGVKVFTPFKGVSFFPAVLKVRCRAKMSWRPLSAEIVTV